MGLRQRIIVFIHDLKTFNHDILLQNYTDSSFMSKTYFTIDEIVELKSIEINGMSLDQCLNNLIEKKSSNGCNICSSHDLFPLYERYFGISKNDCNNKNIKSARCYWRLWRENRFSELVKEGL